MNETLRASTTRETDYNRPKNILVLNYHELTEDARVFKQARALASKGHYVYGVCRWLDGYPKLDNIEGIRISRFHCFSHDHVSRSELAKFFFLESSFKHVRKRFLPYAEEAEKLASLRNAKDWASTYFREKADQLRAMEEFNKSKKTATSSLRKIDDSLVFDVMMDKQAEQCLAKAFVGLNEQVKRWNDVLKKINNDGASFTREYLDNFEKLYEDRGIDQSSDPEQSVKRFKTTIGEELKRFRELRDQVRTERDRKRRHLDVISIDNPEAVEQADTLVQKNNWEEQGRRDVARSEFLGAKAARSQVYKEFSEQRRMCHQRFSDLFQASSLVFATNLLREEIPCKPDLIHAHDFYTLPGAILLSQRYGAKLLYDAHEYEPGRASKMPPEGPLLVDKMELDCLRYVDRMTTPAPIASKLYSERFLGPHPGVIMNAPEIDLSHLTEGAIDSDLPNLRERTGVTHSEKVIIYTGGVQQEKRGLDKVVEALVELPDYHLVILGPRHDRDDAWLLDCARVCGVFDRIHMLPPVEARDVVASIRDADVAICPIQDAGISYRYCFPNKLFEATFALVPICVSDLPELRNFVTRLGNGRTMDQTSPKRIAATLREVVENREKYQMSDRTKKLLIEEYSWPAQVKILTKLVGELLTTDLFKEPRTGRK